MSQEGIKILFARFSQEFEKKKWDNYISLLPNEEKKRIEKHTRWEGRKAGLIGRLLLMDGLKMLSGKHPPTLKIRYNKQGRPEIEGEIDFNISHSGQYVVCALSKVSRVGIDIEKIRAIKWEKFKRWIPSSQWTVLHKSANPNDDFFYFWSMNEAILKGNGQGLAAIADLHTEKGSKKSRLREEDWFSEEILLNEEYRCHLACNKENISHTIEELFY